MKASIKIIQKKLLILSLSVVGTFIFSQTKDDIKKMEMKTDTVALKKIAERLKQMEVSVEDLKKKAKEKNIPYSGYANGRYFQLQGFDGNDQPIYYTTNQNESLEDNKILKQEEGTKKRKTTCKCKGKSKK